MPGQLVNAILAARNQRSPETRWPFEHPIGIVVHTVMARHAWLEFLAAAALTVAACSTTRTPTGPTVPAADTPAATAPTPAPMPAPTPVAAPATARYHATFQATWSAGSHPVDFPSTAHFSPLVGGTHTARVTFWREGVLATAGIRDMAERGLTTRLSEEIDAAIAAGTAEHIFTGGNIGISPGTAAADFEISQSHPLITLVSMIAPSPDWFVGVSALPLFAGGQWVDERRIELLPWDAGTDSGATFTSPDLVSAPPVPIAPIASAPLAPSGRVVPLGTFTFTRVP